MNRYDVTVYKTYRVGVKGVAAANPSAAAKAALLHIPDAVAHHLSRDFGPCYSADAEEVQGFLVTPVDEIGDEAGPDALLLGSEPDKVWLDYAALHDFVSQFAIDKCGEHGHDAWVDEARRVLAGEPVTRR